MNKSNCCNAAVEVSWGCTQFYRCTECESPCDIHEEEPSNTGDLVHEANINQ